MLEWAPEHVVCYLTALTSPTITADVQLKFIQKRYICILLIEVKGPHNEQTVAIQKRPFICCLDSNCTLWMSVQILNKNMKLCKVCPGFHSVSKASPGWQLIRAILSISQSLCLFDCHIVVSSDANSACVYFVLIINPWFQQVHCMNGWFFESAFTWSSFWWSETQAFPRYSFCRQLPSPWRHGEECLHWYAWKTEYIFLLPFCVDALVAGGFVHYLLATF